jgi:hypothetical protein
VHSENPIQTIDFLIDPLIVGDYTAVVCEDLNQNGLFDPLTLTPFVRSELNHAYAKPIQVRANWEVIIDWPSWMK